MSQENKIKKGKIYIIILFAVGAILIIIGSVVRTGETADDSYGDYVDILEEKLESFLLDVKGITKAEVIISTEYKNDGDKTTIQIKGAVVACTNGDNDKTKEEITEIVSKFLGIGANKVKITGIK